MAKREKRERDPKRERMITAVVPEVLIERLDALAAAERRSRTRQLVRLLELALGPVDSNKEGA